MTTHDVNTLRAAKQPTKPDFSYLAAGRPEPRTIGVTYKLTAAEVQVIRDGASATNQNQTDYVATATRLLMDLHGIAEARGVSVKELLEGL